LAVGDCHLSDLSIGLECHNTVRVVDRKVLIEGSTHLARSATTFLRHNTAYIRTSWLEIQVGIITCREQMYESTIDHLM